LESLPVFTGVHFSNELVDALPFHLVRSTGEGWGELCVEYRENTFAFTPTAPSPAIKTDCAALPPRAAGYVTELRPAAATWIKAVAQKLHRGYLLAVDYGFSRNQLLAEHRTEGTYSCYRSHRRDARPLEDVGEKDITAHVDFTALSGAAMAAGLRREGWTDQHHFMVGAAEDLMRTIGAPTDAAAQKTLRGLQTLLHPASMGTQFSYLAFSQGIAEGAGLSGFRYARPVA
jgi:SAM-dependent MidA family methyltransferase